jgi:hypothetical protein
VQISNISLINSIAHIPADVLDRLHIRREFQLSGIERIFTKLERIDDPAIDKQIEKYRHRAELDVDKEFGEELSLYSDISQPQELLERILDSLADAPDGLNFLVQTLRSMLLIKGEPEHK